MSVLRVRLLFFSFLGSFAASLVQRGVYFYCHERLGFSDTANLWLALGVGAIYVLGSLSSHAISRRIGERALLVAMVVTQALTNLLLAWRPTDPVVMVVGVHLISVWLGLLWPVVESYVAAGQDARTTSAALGRFNLAWSSAVPAAFAASGIIIAQWPVGLFVVGLVGNFACLVLGLRLPRQPQHLPDDHHGSMEPAQRVKMVALLRSSRWSLTSSYMLFFLLTPLLPGILVDDLALPVAVATAVASLMDATRFVTFLAMQLSHRWHGKVWHLAVAAAVLPVMFFAILLGGSVAMIVGGEVVFGVAAGYVYYAALYYAMIVRNAAVDAGGGHETMIGLGFTLGPAAAITGKHLAPIVGGAGWGVTLGITPLIAVCTGMALWVLRPSSELRA